jgi:hypothetical protein
MGAFLAFINPINTLLDKLLPDKSQNDAAKAALLSMQLKGELDSSLAQIQVNSVEAQNKSVFVAGWRPFVGWCCGFSFAYNYILQPTIQTLLVVFHSNFDPTKLPKVDISEMMPVLLGMLGLAAARTVEKIKGQTPGQ